jgi:hypothetical protein
VHLSILLSTHSPANEPSLAASSRWPGRQHLKAWLNTRLERGWLPHAGSHWVQGGSWTIMLCQC